MFLQAGWLLTNRFPGNVTFPVPISCSAQEIPISVASRITLKPVLKRPALSCLDSKAVPLHGLGKLH